MTDELYSVALIRRTIREIQDGVQPIRLPDKSTDEHRDAGMAVIHHVDVRTAFEKLPDIYKRAIRAELRHGNDWDAMAMELGIDRHEFKIIIQAAYSNMHRLLNNNA